MSLRRQSVRKTMEKIIVTISKKGIITADVKNSSGGKCRNLTEGLRSLGTVLHDELKPEYYQEEVFGVGEEAKAS